MKEVLRRVCAVLVIVAMTGYYSFDGGVIKADGIVSGGRTEEIEICEVTGEELIESHDTSNNEEVTKGSKEENKKSYIVKLKDQKSLNSIKEKYKESDCINENSENNLEEKKIASVELSKKQVNQLEKSENVEFLEEDYLLEACQNNQKKKHAKKEKRLKNNTSNHEWNVRMIRAEEKAESTKEHVKVAVLDSGIDWGNDINLVYQISLVPGEEEMTQVFMDGSGHGSSVASLIAAKDDGKGITGINPNVDIYSYRVLGEGNRAPVSRVVEAIYMAIEQKVNIINMSFGVSEYSEALKSAIHAAKQEGILIIAAAGNTGEEGVQYPAAYEDVMAVGAVNKYGTVEDYSAKGKEVELVAPGELVRTTGFIGTEEVISGTSLAAPQVTAVASLIWQKDLSVTADFVRGLLDESANLYGKTDAYGNGLVDAEYALSHYDEYKRNFVKATRKQSDALLSQNESEIITFENTKCVKGSWKGDDHVSMINEGYYNVRAGARLPDKEYKVNGKVIFKTAGLNPWWHGFYEQNQGPGSLRGSNYLKAVFTISSIGDAVNKNGKTKYNTCTYTKYGLREELFNDLKEMDTAEVWTKELNKIKAATTAAKNQADTKGFRRAIIWGMAIHCATDIYAHSACVNGKVIDHIATYNGVPQADSQYISDRYALATRAAKQMLTAYSDKRQPVIYDIIPLRKFNGFTLKNLSSYAKEFDANLSGVIFDYGYSRSSK